VIASLLAIAILLYDIVLKRTAAGPVAMGACRFLNVLLGASVGIASGFAESWAGFQPHQVAAAAGIGIYVVGVTAFASHEASESSRPQLFTATVVMAAGILVLGLIHRLLPPLPRSGLHLQSETVWWALLALLAFTILRRAAVAISDPRPSTVQVTVKVAILSINVLDAAVALEVSHWFYAVGLLALLVPTMILGRWIPTT
jgi:4-hydroxybenzoate polyprenyltransferase